MAEINGILNGAPSSQQQLNQLNEYLAMRAYLNGFFKINFKFLILLFLDFFRHLKMVMYLIR